MTSVPIQGDSGSEAPAAEGPESSPPFLPLVYKGGQVMSRA